jgi:hypothetical protein
MNFSMLWPPRHPVNPCSRHRQKLFSTRLTKEIILFCCAIISSNIEYLPRTLALNSCKQGLYFQRGAAAAMFVKMFTNSRSTTQQPSITALSPWSAYFQRE